MLLTLVDEHNQVIGSQPIGEVDFATSYYRVAAMILLNDQNEVLIAQRSLDKEHSPGVWGPSAAGMLESHEEVRENAIKETEEEVGFTLDDAEVVEGPTIYTERSDPKRQYFLHWFFARSNAPIESFMLQEDEVAAVAWIALDELRNKIETDPGQYIDLSDELLTQLEHALPKS